MAGGRVNGDVVSMLTCLRFKRLQNRARGCNQVRINSAHA